MSEHKLDAIKNRWKEENRYVMIDLAPYRIFNDAQRDVEYLLTKIEESMVKICTCNGYESRHNCPIHREVFSIKYSYPNHEQSQTVDSHPCPECGDRSLIPVNHITPASLSHRFGKMGSR